MGLSGKYNFKGIKDKGAAGLRLLFSSTTYLSWFNKIPLSDLIFEFIANWLANKGLIILNVGAIYVNGELDQNALDKAIDEGLKKVETNLNLTPEQMKVIDDEVIKAARKAIPYTKPGKP